MGDFDRPQIRKGMQLNGIYEIDEPLAAGGMGEVYRGHTIQTGDVVAIKLIRDDLTGDEAALALFRREASALHSLHHEAIVRYFVFSIDPVVQRPYLAMEFVEGEALSDILRKGSLPLDAILALKQRIASGLDAAHRRGIVHRDISPDNIIVPDGDFARARIIDFGIARSAKTGDATVIGSGFAGKHNYVSPEQLGLFGGEVTPKSDIYSLGLVLAYASCGRPLDMKGSQAEVIDKRRTVPDIACADPQLHPLLKRMLQPDPADRLASMREVELWTPAPPAGASEGTIIRLPPERAVSTPPAEAAPLARQTRPAPRKTPWIAMTGAAAIVVALAGAGVLMFRGGAPHDAAPPGESAMQAETRKEPPATEPAKASVETPAISPLEKARALIAQADLGPCGVIALTELSDARVALSGFGLDAKPFEQFDKALRAATGLEAEISLRKIARAQCPAIDFLKKAQGRDRQAARIETRSTVVRGDEIFAGSILATEPNVELLVVDDDGQTYNATAVLRGEGAQRRFAMRLQQDGDPRARQPLLLVVTSAAPFEALRTAAKASASDIFARAAKEIAAHPEASAAAIAFEIE